ncbi:MAG: leucine--tRNA ligase [Nanoarchaeota archaeon]|nr:leucine--tRNA ligase [Nanoarchaeota archaeon]
MINPEKLQEKWNKRWDDAKIFEATPKKGQKKFFGTFPYPYINLYPHIGHFYSLMKLEALHRYKRMQGHNVLYAQGWHATGSPMVNAAQRVKEGEEKQINILKDMGFPDEDIPKFEDPLHWIKVFSKGWENDLKEAGCSIDWRRNFHTTSLNPHYNKFIKWQFRLLKEKGFVKKGKKPVVWCEKCNSAIGDHSRVAGEGETPQEFTLLKFKFEDSYLIAATLRPETVYGQTNMWVDPKEEYVKAKVKSPTMDEESWILSKEAVEKLKLQNKDVEVTGTINGSEMIGKYCIAPAIDRKIIILPSYFCDSNIGSGLVTSVPSHAPFDWMGIYDLQQDKSECEKWGLDWEEILKIKPIALIELEGWGEHPAIEICEKYKIKNQKEFEKLEKAKKVIYKAEHFSGKMNEVTGKYKGMTVEEAKEKVKENLIKNGDADIMYEPTGKVVCRCLTEAKIKIVSDQWFLTYGDKKWKKTAHEALDSMKLYPEKVRAQFEYVLDWLNDWACTHESESELGTHLPWDTSWVIESLSDSTIYMAYYTIAHRIKDIDPDKIDDKFFDYVFLGKGAKKEIDIDGKLLDELHEEFDYWYPMDYRTSGKDLIQNHMSFSIFNHCAIFPKKHWPRAFGLNGWVTVDGNKMSKALGNVIPVRKMVTEFGSDASRLTVLSGGEGLDDANWDSEMARSLKEKLNGMLEFAEAHHDKGIDEMRAIDEWMEAQIDVIVKETTESYEEMLFRSAIQRAYFDIQRHVKWYMRRTNGKVNKKVMNRLIEAQLLLLAPITPFICEEAWEKIGKQGFISTAEWPEFKKNIDVETIALEKVIEETISDINSVLKITGIEKPKTIKLIVSVKWKYALYKKLSALLEKTRNFSDIMKEIMKDDNFKKESKAVSGIIQKAIKTGSVPVAAGQDKEFKAVSEARDFFEKEFGCSVIVEKAEKSKEQKAGAALPGKVGVVVG